MEPLDIRAYSKDGGPNLCVKCHKLWQGMNHLCLDINAIPAVDAPSECFCLPHDIEDHYDCYKAEEHICYPCECDCHYPEGDN